MSVWVYATKVQVPEKTRRHWIPSASRRWHYRWLWAAQYGCLDPNMGPLEEQRMLLTTWTISPTRPCLLICTCPMSLGLYSPVECEKGLDEVDYASQTQLYQPSRFQASHVLTLTVTKWARSVLRTFSKENQSQRQAHRYEERCYGEKIRRTEL